MDPPPTPPGAPGGVAPLPDRGTSAPAARAGPPPTTLERLPADTRRLVLVAAAATVFDGPPALDLLHRAARRAGLSPSCLDPAEDTGLLVVDGDLVRFRDPHLRDAVYREAPRPHLRAAHAVVADVLDPGPGGLRRLCHRAAATVGPDDRLAAALARAVDRHSPTGRGPLLDHAQCSTALASAARLTTDARRRARRVLAAVDHAWLAGDPRRAWALLTAPELPAADDDVVGRRELVRGALELRGGVVSDAHASLELAAALLRPHGGPLARAALMDRLAASWASGDLPRHLAALDHAAADDPPGPSTAGNRPAAETPHAPTSGHRLPRAPRFPDVRLAARLAGVRAAAHTQPWAHPAATRPHPPGGGLVSWCEAPRSAVRPTPSWTVHRHPGIPGTRTPPEATERPLPAPRQPPDPPRPGRHPSGWEADYAGGLAAVLRGRPHEGTPLLRRMLDGELDGAVPLFAATVAALAAGRPRDAATAAARALASARAGGPAALVPIALEHLAHTELVLGDHARAHSHASAGLRAAHRAGQPNQATHHRALLAFTSALLGEEESCHDHAARAAREAAARGLVFAETLATWALAMLDLAGRRPETAADRLRPLLVGSGPRGHFAAREFAVPSLVEAAVLAGDTHGVHAPLRRFERWAAATGDPDRRAQALRCRALLHADDSGADALFREAIDLHERAGQGFEQGRTRLLHGEALRRRRSPGAARDQLRAALVLFELCGARQWATRARDELRAVGDSPPRAVNLAGRRRRTVDTDRLTPQQLRIARAVASGNTNREVAVSLRLSPRTVDHHLRNVFATLGVRSRVELTLLLSNGGSDRDDTPTASGVGVGVAVGRHPTGREAAGQASVTALATAHRRRLPPGQQPVFGRPRNPATTTSGEAPPRPTSETSAPRRRSLPSHPGGQAEEAGA
ncbi:helix-turn-helix transcriptional regulator [Actinoalloteichus caeruleus]|uniref:helix-turn-helix transcriptional regulator n=2 Tax=Actinoalloteichus cyanogriseus TaxID=2893586 RepID=UPI00068DDE91|nr:LuxR family transcriptional regulator [Actinoalloteichus caeruleus]